MLMIAAIVVLKLVHLCLLATAMLLWKSVIEIRETVYNVDTAPNID